MPVFRYSPKTVVQTRRRQEDARSSGGNTCQAQTSPPLLCETTFHRYGHRRRPPRLGNGRAEALQAAFAKAPRPERGL
ncbi:predicted protein [Chaetomium globosum CBS 148.51]|uniref:Uncharacterized protein n=1 Tax=Chaetomium globosum (strain ATCC 6205 / CBS 148.51 / DSM 1962 / NBRC 6347 / NRRL 1970) TaxID=306901 RepID=Q2GPS1_CHAGB|nr:uncharacterized protein CHGG_10033 [Chaetomium globosum CBS 148.51]EAQ83629.1 predicted protein [Chaetomium globosum CBS 148.51]